MPDCPLDRLKCRINVEAGINAWVWVECSACGKRWPTRAEGKTKDWLSASYQAALASPSTPGPCPTAS